MRSVLNFRLVPTKTLTQTISEQKQPKPVSVTVLNFFNGDMNRDYTVKKVYENKCNVVLTK
jgi:hypothetical protein